MPGVVVHPAFTHYTFAHAQCNFHNSTMQHQQARPLIDNLFRHESGKLIAVLTKIFGPHNLELAEDVVQDTLVKALEVWRLQGVPDNPSAWLFTVAKNKALDVLRRERYKKEYAVELNALLTSAYSASSTVEQMMHPNTIDDELLRMMFVCCHPTVPEESQIALILKTLCGFSVMEIAKAFLTNEETITKRLYRARQQFREEKVRFALPSDKALVERLNNVHTAIYLLFNEGYHASQSDQLIRDDLLEEALRLGNLLVQHPSTRTPQTFALLSLMCLQAARVYSRVDHDGNICLLPAQDRTTWDQELIERGRIFLNRASTGDHISSYHIEAAIAFEHCKAKNYKETDWQKILQLYELLSSLKPDPVVALNKLIVAAEVCGIADTIKQLEALSKDPVLKNYALLYITLSDWYDHLGERNLSDKNLDKAIECVHSPKEKEFLNKKRSSR